MAAKKPNDEQNKVMDISAPGKGKIIPNSRPIVAAVVDPSASGNESASSSIEEVKPIAPPSETRRVIQPINMSSEESVAEEPKPPTNKPSLPIEITGEEEKDTAEVITVTTVKSVETSEKQTSEAKTTDSETAPTEVKESEPIQPEAPAEVSEKSPEEEPKEAEDDKPKPEADPKPAENAQTPEPAKKPETGEANTHATEGSDAAGVDALVDSVETKKEAAKKAEEDTQKEAVLEELISSKKYYVPIGVESPAAKSHKSHHGIMIFIVILLVLLAGAYLVVDAEIVDLGFDVPYELIQN
jgi:hypothetical protein